MFDLITSGTRHPFHDRTIGPQVLSIMIHGVAVGLIVAVPMLYVTVTLPEAPSMMAFVVAAPPPPPPPPPPRARQKAAATAQPKPAATSGALAAPLTPLPGIRPEPVIEMPESLVGIEGGVEGGIVGGVAGGIVGGLLEAPPPPATPLPVAAPRKPVRIGGQLSAPALVHRVEPVYPTIAVVAKVGGTVILEAVVNVEGRVESVRVLRSIKLLDAAAVRAVEQWQYSPLMLNGVPAPFVLTVSLSFRLE